MLVRFKFGDQVIELNVSESWNILFIKQRACFEFGIDPHLFFMFYNNKTLDDWSKATEENILNGAIIEICSYRSCYHFYVLCYVCDTVVLANIATKCNSCQSEGFIIEQYNISPNQLHYSGKCIKNECPGMTGSILYRCAKHPFHQPAVFLKHITRNIEHHICIACSSSEAEVIITFCPESGHSLCFTCFKLYAECYLVNRKFVLVPETGYTLECPVGCPDSYISDAHHFRILGHAFYSRYKDLATRQVCISEGYCSCPNCGLQWQLPAENLYLNWALCQKPYGCGERFCTACQSAVSPINSDSLTKSCKCILTDTCHSPRSGDNRLHSWQGVQLSPIELASHKLIAETCKPCPTCKSQTNKDGGCNHMHCLICGSDWCWICLIVWSQDCQSSHWF